MTLLEWFIVLLVLLWVAGIVVPVTGVGNLVHVLLVIVLVLVLVRLIQGR